MVSYVQATRFNAHVTINGVAVGHMKPEQALKHLSELRLKNDIYIDKERVINGKNSVATFSGQDLSKMKQIFEKQKTWWPSFKTRNFSLMPKQQDTYRSVTLKKQLEDKLNQLNKQRKAPKDAYAYLSDGVVHVAKSENGNQFDRAKIMNDYEHQSYQSVIHLKRQFLQPVTADSETVQKEKSTLQALRKRQVTYTVQNKDYVLKADAYIKNASVSSDLKLKIDSADLKHKVAEINKNQSTLNKKFSFKTHSGKIISVQGESYGWALEVSDETKRITKAFEDSKPTLKAYNVYGVGYSTYGIGYHNTANNGIGNTYAEVSISEQKIWIYQNGKLVLSTDVVTGRHDTQEDTPKGLWYIMYKESPSVLEGSEAGNSHYSVKVDYWAPFTMSGCGFHDASWRRNWKKDAYLTQGSGGCVNTPPKVMKTVYDHLEQNEPVIIY
ncbi:ErfK/YbiS/YcfS/YnhG family protein [Sporolactobacillus inulinus]|uniref:ErfK/YbiS/YcfS/YnhG family protein n=1 Tax=Sporolactobacillus inulinus TaxID=2078 RepID=A0A4Y1Z8C6_9BACL|nr:L,D-transpeptidase family protein [Sporolactobacillus inulinus]GAY75282.1 ErfK/YbiS/YcfS/YnhG family protein [Sporolactobacillus inulinus]